jgi:hypothetical protein
MGAAAVARGHSEDMRDNRFVAHVSPTTGDVSDRVKRIGMKVAWLAENVGLADSPDAVHEGLMESPGHRVAILADEATHVGIGAAYDADGDLLVTQVFLKLALPLVAKEGRAEIMNVLARMASAAPQKFGLDPVMDKVAAEAAARYASGAQPAGKIGSEAGSKLTSMNLGGYSAYRALVGVAREPGKLIEPATIDAAKVRAVGIGVAIGRRKGSSLDEYFVVILLGMR